MNSLVIRRPLYVFALVFFFMTVVLLGTNEQHGLRVAIIAAFSLWLVLCVPLLRHVTVLTVIICAVLVSSLLVYTRYMLTVQPLENLNDATAEVTLRVEQLPQGNSKLYRTSVVEGDVLPAGMRLCVSFADTETAPQQYDTVEGAVSLYLPSEQQSYLHGEDIFLLGYFEAETAITAGEVKWYERLAGKLRGEMLTGMYAALPDVEGDLLAAVCLGETTSLPENVEEDFRKSGLSHLLVVSGLHMTVLVGAMDRLLRFMKVRRGVALMITLSVLWLFMLMVGFGYSVIRSAVMLHFVLIGQTLRLRADARTSLAAALLLIVLQNPYAVQDVGFLLSFAATLGLVVLTPVANTLCKESAFLNMHAPARVVVFAFCTPLAAMAFTAPILAYAFGTLSLLSPLANVLTVWPTTVLLCVGMLGAVLYCIPGVSLLSKGFFLFAGSLAKWTIWVAEKIADISVAQLQIRHSVLVMLLILVPMAVYWSWKLLGKRGLRRALAVGVVLVLICGSALTVFSRKTVSVRVASAEETLATVIETGGRTMAIISGENYDACTAARYFLTSCGVDALEVLVVTDGDTTVTAALAELLETVPAKTVIYPHGNVDLTAGISGIIREPVEENVGFVLWNDMTLTLYNGWWQMTAGETRLLFAPADGNVKELPDDWRQAHLAVFCGEVPETVSLLETQYAVMLCAPQDVRYITGELPWGRYPIHLTAVDGDITLCTTGSGSIVTANRYYL